VDAIVSASSLSVDCWDASALLRLLSQGANIMARKHAHLYLEFCALGLCRLGCLVQRVQVINRRELRVDERECALC